MALKQGVASPRVEAMCTLPLRVGQGIGVMFCALLLSACASHYRGVECRGEIKTLAGQPLGVTQALIIDRFNSFSVAMPKMTVESGPLKSTDRNKYLPSAVTREGFLAQRVSDHKFSIINAPANQWVSYTCP
ncbi:hypothetical protein AAH678_21275 [Sodalis endosymbiont of Spalangia cameroni]|uniref:hypothetical protein n=1 Tax=Sodalis TaxID=84565 RepID=UPI0031F74382